MRTKTYEELQSEVMTLREMNARLREESERQRAEIDEMRRTMMTREQADATHKARIAWVLFGQ